MNDNQKDFLLNLYKTHPIDEVDANFSGQIAAIMGVKDYAELKNNKEFEVYNLLLKSCRMKYEQLLVTKEENLQICTVLDILWAARSTSDELNFKTSREFFRGTIYLIWIEDNRVKFDFAVDEIISRRHVFISYTNRNARLNNSLYKQLIESWLTSEQLTQSNLDKKNLVVWAIKQQLIDSDQLTGYFDQDRDDFQNGQTLNPILQTYCNGSTTFLQFVEKKTFDTQNTYNYCFEEFRFYSQGYCKIRDKMTDQRLSDGYFFIKNLISEETPMLYPVNLSQGYIPWKDVIEGKTVYLRLHSKTTVPEFLVELTRLASDIKERVDSIFDSYKKIAFPNA
jgi:hypothetical protein